ncbi:hypothetical protein ACFFX0_16540 [Citricoccus parietis]|uniref:Uncharacterized protein n=1 Tax=Citricoccus parietis TaxID=592307 RepID=A0ABV5G1A3_9MICC
MTTMTDPWNKPGANVDWYGMVNSSGWVAWWRLGPIPLRPAPSVLIRIGPHRSGRRSPAIGT